MGVAFNVAYSEPIEDSRAATPRRYARPAPHHLNPRVSPSALTLVWFQYEMSKGITVASRAPLFQGGKRCFGHLRDSDNFATFPLPFV